MKREKKLTKRERKAEKGIGPSGNPKETQHIHCIACGRHIEPSEFGRGPASRSPLGPSGASSPVRFNAPATAMRIACQHKSQFPSCAGCADRTRALLAEHDRTGQPVQTAAAWH